MCKMGRIIPIPLIGFLILLVNLVESQETNLKDCGDLTLQIVPASKSSSFYRTRRRQDDLLDKYVFQHMTGKVETVEGEDFEIVIRGPEPLQWSYEGLKNPGELSLVPIVDQARSCYTVRLTRRPDVTLIAGDTGLYSGRYVNNPGKKVAVYLYVPNKYPPFLLNTEHLVTVNWKEGKPLVLPCLLNNPDKAVFLSKRKGLNEWAEVENQDGNYDPRLGFTIKKQVNGQENLYGSYKCFTSLHNRNDTMFIYVGNDGF